MFMNLATRLVNGGTCPWIYAWGRQYPRAYPYLAAVGRETEPQEPTPCSKDSATSS